MRQAPREHLPTQLLRTEVYNMPERKGKKLPRHRIFQVKIYKRVERPRHTG
jgi:hypothetical protein